MLVAGYFASLIIGISLGLIGGGGSVLTVPVLVYLFGIDPVLASAYSLFIVGVSSLAGAIPKGREGLIDLRTAVLFGIPSIIAVFLTRRFLLPAIPADLFSVGSFQVTKPLAMMVVFAILMVFASISMIRERSESRPSMEKEARPKYLLILIEGLVVGTLTGLVGAGGGFLIIPALVLLSHLPMKKAVGTSLLIIAAKSIIGFLGDLSHTEMDWKLLLTVTAIAVAGIVLGHLLGRKVNSRQLKKGFGVFILVMGVYIIVQQLFFPLS